MKDPIKEIAIRLRGLRESLELTPECLADKCGLNVETYMGYETGTLDIPMSALHNVAQHLGVELTALLSGSESHVNNYSVTRAGQGINIERRTAYNYELLASTFQHRRAEPFIVTVEPSADDQELSFNSHDGQEFIYVLSGELKLYVGDAEVILKEEDSIYFDPSHAHAMRAMNDQACKFMATIIA